MAKAFPPDFTAMDRLFAVREETRGVVILATPAFCPEQSDPANAQWVWTYHIRIANRRDRAVTLVARRWTIVDGRGTQTQVRGPGVVGQQPCIAPGHAHDYVSGCALPTSRGEMRGQFEMVDADGRPFQAIIPVLRLTDGPWP